MWGISQRSQISTKPWSMKWSNNNIAYDLMDNQNRPLLETHDLRREQAKIQKLVEQNNDPKSSD